MINKMHSRLLPFICLILATGILASCKKDNDGNSGQVELLSFGPTGAQHGDTLFFIGSNLHKVTAIEMTGAAIQKNEFKKQTSEEIQVIIPDAAEQGFVTLKSPDGDVVSKTRLNFEVAIQVSSITPQARPGENITIKGKHLNWVTSVTFNRDKVVQNFVSRALDQLVVTVPADAQTGPLVLSYGGTEPTELQTRDTLKIALPVASGLSPNPVKHQTNLTITGTNLDLVRQIKFVGVANPVTQFVSQSATQLVVVVPQSAEKGKITLVAPSGVTTETAELQVALPAITAMAPDPVDPGANLTITGTNLDIVSSVSFVGVANAVTSFVSKTATQLVVKVPTGALTGKLTFGVQNSTLTVRSANDLKIVGSSVPPIIIFDDALTSAWNGWTGGGWGGTKDVNNTSPVKSGTKSVKIDYTSGGYGVPWQLGGANISLAGYTSLRFSIYGGTGSNGKSVNVGFNEVDGRTVTVTEGQWTDYTIPLSQISSAATLTHLYFKNYSASGDFTVYIDNVGIY